MIDLKIKDDRKAFLPGEDIEVNVKWGEGCGDTMSVELMWCTSGKGSSDEHSADTFAFPISNTAGGDQNVKLSIPSGPYSFSGKLISLTWSVCASGDQGEDSAEVEIVVAPEKKEIQLYKEIQVVD